jgi:hypothetical protein
MDIRVGGVIYECIGLDGMGSQVWEYADGVKKAGRWSEGSWSVHMGCRVLVGFGSHAFW